MSFQEKYLKYKEKYLKLKNMIGGGAGNVNTAPPSRLPHARDHQEILDRIRGHFYYDQPDSPREDVDLSALLAGRGSNMPSVPGSGGGAGRIYPDSLADIRARGAPITEPSSPVTGSVGIPSSQLRIARYPSEMDVELHTPYYQFSPVRATTNPSLHHNALPGTSRVMASVGGEVVGEGVIGPSTAFQGHPPPSNTLYVVGNANDIRNSLVTMLRAGPHTVAGGAPGTLETGREEVTRIRRWWLSQPQGLRTESGIDNIIARNTRQPGLTDLTFANFLFPNGQPIQLDSPIDLPGDTRRQALLWMLGSRRFPN